MTAEFVTIYWEEYKKDPRDATDVGTLEKSEAKTQPRTKWAAIL
jgi:hypothetical protein